MEKYFIFYRCYLCSVVSHPMLLQPFVHGIWIFCTLIWKVSPWFDLFIICHLMWHASHLHTSARVSNTFTQSDCNAFHCYVQAVTRNFEKYWFLMKFFQRSWHFSSPYLSPSSFSFSISTRKKHMCQVRTSCWAFCWTLVSQFSCNLSSIHFHTGIVQWNLCPALNKNYVLFVLPLLDTGPLFGEWMMLAGSVG